MPRSYRARTPAPIRHSAKGTIPPTTLAVLRALQAEVEAGRRAQATIDAVLTALAERDGHEIAAVRLTAIDLIAGTFAVAPAE